MASWLYNTVDTMSFGLIYAISKRFAQHSPEDYDEIQTYREPPLLINKLPLGMDNLWHALQASKESRLMEHFLSNFRRVGNTFQQVLGGRSTIVTIDPANIATILSAGGKWSIGLRRDILLPFIGDGIFTQDGQEWKHSRDMLRPELVHRKYQDLDVFHGPVDDLIDVLGQKTGQIVDLQALFLRATLDVTTKLLFGESVGSLRNGDNEFASAFNEAQRISATRMRFQTLYWLVGGRKYREACATVNKFADRIIDQNLRNLSDSTETKDGGLAGNLVQVCRDREAARGQIVSILLAGRDTTALLLSWLMFHLVRHPESMSKIRQEIRDQGFDVKEINRSNLLQLQYLQNTIKEVLRLHPSVPLFGRTATETTSLPTGGGPDGTYPVVVTKGTSVYFSSYSLHRRPDLFGMDAAIFRPERWEKDGGIISEDPIDRKWGYLPFSGGPRICLGMDFAITEAAYIVVRLLERFPSITLPAGEKVQLVGSEKQNLTLVLQISEGCNVELH